MPKFLNTSATSYYLEELIKQAKDLKISDRIKELLEDKNRMKIDIRIVYGKSELQPAEANWLKTLDYVRTSYCANLHAKCYISEGACIITSLNLYEFSQINNNEMGILLIRRDDAATYKEAHDEAHRIIRISEEVKISLDVVEKKEEFVEDTSDKQYNHLTAAKLAEKWGIDTTECNKRLCEAGLQELQGKSYHLTEKGKAAGGIVKKGKFGYFIVYPEELTL